MCYIQLKREDSFHVIAVEVRQNEETRIYNSWANSFLFAWFSSAEEEKDDFFDNLSTEFKKVLNQYRSDCGKGKFF